MKKTKKFVSILLALVLTVSSFSILSAVTASAVTDTKVYFDVPTDSWGEVKWNSKHTQAAVYCHLYRVYGGSDLKETTFATKNERCEWEHDNIYSFDTTTLGTIEDKADYAVIFCADCIKGGKTIRYQTCNMTMGIPCLGDIMIATEETRPSDVDSEKLDYLGEWTDPENKENFGPMACIDSTAKLLPGKFPFYAPKQKFIGDKLYDPAFKMKVNAKYFNTQRLNELEAELGVTARQVLDYYIGQFEKSIEEKVLNKDLVDTYDSDNNHDFCVPLIERVAERLGIASYVVAGSKNFLGTKWDGSPESGNVMTKDGEVYTFTKRVSPDPNNKDMRFKICANYGDRQRMHGLKAASDTYDPSDFLYDTNDFDCTFKVTKETDVTISYDFLRKTITVTGDGVEMTEYTPEEPEEETTVPEPTTEPVPTTTAPVETTTAPEPTTIPEPTTVPEPTTQPVTEPEPVYVVAGSEAFLGVNWNGSPESGNVMTKDSESGLYTFTVYNFDVIDQEMMIKVVENIGDSQTWYGDESGQNVSFSVKKPTDVTVTFDPKTAKTEVTGDGVVSPFVLEIKSVRIAGAADPGKGSWLNGISWKPDADENLMTEISDKVYSITFNDLPAEMGYEFKLAANGSWNANWGLADGETAVLNAPMNATFNGNNILFDLEEDSNVTVKLDLTNFDTVTKNGAVITIEVQPAIGIYGDADGDGDITIADVTAIQLYLAELGELTPTQKLLADVDGDGDVSISDATCIQMYLANFLDSSGKTNQPAYM